MVGVPARRLPPGKIVVSVAYSFLVEVLMLSLWHHRNLVNLIGYCVDGDQMILVYEYMPLVSLEDHLYGIDISNHLILGSLRVNEIFMNTLVLLLL